MRSLRPALLALLIGLVDGLAEPMLLSPPGPPLAGTMPLTLDGDIASNLVAGVDRFLDRKLRESPQRRTERLKEPEVSRGGGEGALNADRRWLAEVLGVVEPRVVSPGLEWVASTAQSSLVATSALVRVDVIRWAAFGDVTGEGLLLRPQHKDPVADVIAVPDVDFTPEQWVGLEPGVPVESQFARRLVEAGCRVVVPFLIDREKGRSKVSWDPKRGNNLSNREYLHRAAFEMGRTLAGYEVLKLLALVDLMKRETGSRPIGVIGWGEGGRLAMCTAALDPRIDATGVSGYFGPREGLWQEPLDRNVFGLLERLGDAEIARLIAPRALLIEAARAPEREFASDGGAPGRVTTPAIEDVRREVERGQGLRREGSVGSRLELVESAAGRGPFGTESWLNSFLNALRPEIRIPAETAPWKDLRQWVDPRARADRQRHELDRHTQGLLLESPYVRERFMRGLDVTSPEKHAETQERYRAYFAERVIGRFDDVLVAGKARSRQAYDDPKWMGYEVVLDVFPEVIAYGLLLVPKDLQPGERRPVVVCQHGLEGRPQLTIGKEGFQYYSAFAARLAEQGFVTFAPQNLYLFEDRFRVLQRKANPLGKTLFSIITPQHQQIVNWLKAQPFVDPARIAFYGLSYGGKTAMRVPALVTDYCLSICSADFNEWVWKNTSTRSPYSYVWSGEYEIFEWNLGHTFNYAEMAALIAPRPFMVERGHFDGVAPDETVAHEFAKVRNWYAARLRLPPESCEIEWFVGPHQIHGVGTYEFLRRHLKWSGAALSR